VLSLIVAMDEQRLIGRAGALPWRLPEDLKHFKRLTLGKTVLMGRKTWDSLGRPLPQRENWVLTSDAGFQAEGARAFASLDAALAAHPAGELMVIGGAELYRQTLAHAQRLYLTEVHATLEGDTWFPDFDRTQWIERVRERHEADERHAYVYSFVTLDRR
jgi:dihydrofolate reductase